MQPQGPVVRVSPNELSFATVESWKAIYGHRGHGPGQIHGPTPTKSRFYDIYRAGFSSGCIGSERDPARHAQMRKLLSSAFSTRSLVGQEAIVDKAVNEFINRIGEVGKGPGGVNMTKWYEMITFDILGEIAFGESFHVTT